MTLDPHERTRLRFLGLTEQDIDALYHLWEHQGLALVPLLSEDAHGLHADLWTLPDAYDALAHQLLDWSGHEFMCHGYTGHQLATIYADKQAHTNLYANPHGKNPEDILTVAAPRQFIVHVLLVAKNPREADDLFHRYTSAAAGQPIEPDDTPTSLQEAFAFTAGFHQMPRLDCYCKYATA